MLEKLHKIMPILVAVMILLNGIMMYLVYEAQQEAKRARMQS